MLSQKNKKSWRNPWFVGMIGVVVTAVLVNSVLIWKAYHDRSTLVDHEYSTNDRKSDTETIDDIQAQNALAMESDCKAAKNTHACLAHPLLKLMWWIVKARRSAEKWRW